MQHSLNFSIGQIDGKALPHQRTQGGLGVGVGSIFFDSNGNLRPVLALDNPRKPSMLFFWYKHLSNINVVSLIRDPFADASNTVEIPCSGCSLNLTCLKDKYHGTVIRKIKNERNGFLCLSGEK